MSPSPPPRPSDADIAHATRDFRAAIDAAGPEPWAQKNIRFPRGACGHAAELLGRYLMVRLGIRPDYVKQEAEKDIGGWTGGHAWLEWDGLTIDITGDQFGWDPVIVTRRPLHHGRGGETVRHLVCPVHEADWWGRECGAIWLAAAPHLPT